jgi:hypothetical protein
MRLKNITNDIEKSKLLNTCFTQTQNPAASLPAFPADIQATLEATATSFQETAIALQERRKDFKIKNDALRSIEQELQMLIRHALHAVKRHYQTDRLPTGIVEAFGLLTDLTQPRALRRRMRAPDEVAGRILAAHQQAQSDGFVVLIDPSPESIQSALSAYQVALAEQMQAKAEERDAFAAMKAARIEADILIKQIKDFVRMRFAGRGQRALRDSLRDLGFRYVSQTSAVDRDDTDDAPVDSGREDDVPDSPTGGEQPPVDNQDEAVALRLSVGPFTEWEVERAS